MIFTRRFGALAARPQFPDVVEIEVTEDLELDLELILRDGEVDQASDESAA